MRKLVVKATAGPDALERCAQALTVSSVAVAAGAEVSLWLTGESVWLAVPGNWGPSGEAAWALPHSPPLGELFDAVLSGGAVTVCTQCAARRDLAAADLAPGVRLAGAAAFVAEALEDETQALVY